jgi:CubicO group peptidase (beta-lactamase class C family)
MKSLYFARRFFVLFIHYLLLVNPAVASMEEVLQKIADRSKASDSDAVLILHNGNVVFEYRSTPSWRPIETMSITKAITALAVGLMLDEGKIDSIDRPIYHFYPEWNQGNKKSITLRHLLAHTSGLQAEPSTDEIYQADNCVQLALCAELSYLPGTYFFYNNKAVNLLSGIVQKVTGTSLNQYLMQRLFSPLGIEQVSWLGDSAGNDYVTAHLFMTAPDLAKIGQMLANQGMWQGKKILSKNWIDLMLQPGQRYEPGSGMLWWIDYYNVECYWDESLLKGYQTAGIDKEFIDRLHSLQGRVIDYDKLTECLGGKDKIHQFNQQIESQKVPFALWTVGGIRSYSARGSGGQQLLIFPHKNLVAVRQKIVSCKDGQTMDPFADFISLVQDLAEQM